MDSKQTDNPNIADLVANEKSFGKSDEPCVSSSMLVEYATGQVNEGLAQHIRAHLLFCDHCAKEVALLWQVREEHPVTAAFHDSSIKEMRRVTIPGDRVLPRDIARPEDVEPERTKWKS